MRGVFTAPYISQTDKHVKVCLSSVRYVTFDGTCSHVPFHQLRPSLHLRRVGSCIS